MGFTPGGGPKNTGSLRTGPAPGSFKLGGGPGSSLKTTGTHTTPSHGGFLSTLGHIGHVVAAKADLAAHDLKSIPGGLVDLGQLEYNALKEDASHPLRPESLHDAVHGRPGSARAKLAGAERQTVHQGVESVKHPLRDPFQTLATVLPILNGGANVIARIGYAGDAIKAGEFAAAAKAASPLHKPPVAPRLLKVGDTEVPLQASKQPLRRAGQAVYDKALQHGLDKEAAGTAGRVASKVGAHAQRRVGGAGDESGRVQQRLRDAPANALDLAAKKLAGTAGTRAVRSGGAKAVGAAGRSRVHQAALELTSVNTTAEKAAAYHAEQAVKLTAEAGKDGAKNPAALLDAAKQNRVVSKLYDTVARRGLLTQNAHGDVVVNAVDHPALAKADLALAKVQGRGDEILKRYGIRSPEDLAQRVNAPGRVREGASYEKPTPAKNGVPSQSLLKAQARVTRLEALHERAINKAIPKMTADELLVHTTPTSPTVHRLGAALSVAKDELQSLQGAAANRVKPTGMIGGDARSLADAYRVLEQKVVAGERRVEHEHGPAHLADPVDYANWQEWSRRRGYTEAEIADFQKWTDINKRLGITAPDEFPSAQRPFGVSDQMLAEKAAAAAPRPGRGFVSYATHEKNAPTSPAAASTGQVVGEAKTPISNHAFTGQGIEHGLVPKDVTGQAARHFRSIVRFVNTTERRNDAIRTGSDTRRSTRDVLVKVPGADHAKINQAVEEVLGRKKPTVDDVNGLNAALDAYRQELVPGITDKFAADMQHPVGTTAADAAAARGLDATDGYKWVDRGALGHLAHAPRGPRGRVARAADNINSAVTAATVYFKIGHVGTRVFTNGITTILQGSAKPAEIADSVRLWHALSDEDKTRALAAAGQHGFAAMPHEGTSLASRIAGHGSNWWAKHADAPFRFASIAYEARHAGYRTPAQFRDLLGKIENPHETNMSAAERSKVMGVANRSNREGIAYDRLNETEQRFLTRGIWFYPWVKGATMFAGNTLLEHPYKAGVAGAAGVEGRQMQQHELGDVPTYEGGLFQLKGGAKPLVADFSTFSPFSTPADLLNTVSRPSELSGMLNPVLGGANAYINGLNRYGDKLSPGQNPLVEALAQIAAPAPETQILSGYLNRNKSQAHKMFPASPALSGTLSPLLRALVGPGLPRRLNPAAAHADAQRQRSGR